MLRQIDRKYVTSLKDKHLSVPGEGAGFQIYMASSSPSLVIHGLQVSLRALVEVLVQLPGKTLTD